MYIYNRLYIYIHIFGTMSQKEPRTSLFPFEFGHVNLRLGPLMTKRKTAMHHLSLQANALTSRLLEETDCASHDDPNANWNHLERNTNNLLVVILSTCLICKFEHIAWNYIWQFNHRGTHAPLIIKWYNCCGNDIVRTLPRKISSLHLIGGRKYSGLGAEIWASLVDVSLVQYQYPLHIKDPCMAHLTYILVEFLW